MSDPQSPVLAAGAICWRLIGGTARILVVHRGERADVSLPKGKVDRGESLPQTAVREILEETGLTVTLGVPLGTVEYVLPSGRDKVVHYWAAEVDEHALELASFQPNSEIAALEWMSLEKVRKKLSYPHDVEVIDRFSALLDAGRARTFAVVIARHGKAVPPGAWDGPDSTRPLMQRGADQAAAIAPAIAAFGPRRIISSTAARCLATIDPLAKLTGLEVKASDAVSQDAWAHDGADVAKLVARRLAKRVGTVFCSHGPVIPQLLAELAAQTGSVRSSALREAASLSTGEFAVVHLPRAESGAPADAGIVAIETHLPAL